MRIPVFIGTVFVCSNLCFQPLKAEFKYLVGGPLAGVEVPKFKTQHGEPAGHPGSTGQLDGDLPFTTEGLYPELQLYPGSVEHYRAYMFKYMPIRSFFDVQSQLKNWVAPNIPGAQKQHAEQYASPVFWVPRHKSVRDTGLKLKPVPVIRCKVGAPEFNLDLGELGIGLYTVRVIAAVAPEQVKDFRMPAFLRMSVNDGIQGETSSYRLRIGYCEEFYSVAEFYFHAPAKRAYQARLALDSGSQVDLLLHNISLDDVMAGIENRVLKRKTTILSAVPEARAKLESRMKAGHKTREPLSEAGRLAKDARIWKAFPPPNAQASNRMSTGYGTVKGVVSGTDKMSAGEIEEKYGKWEPVVVNKIPENFPANAKVEACFLFNAKLGLVYTNDDLRNNRPLPDPYPLKDDGAGLYYPGPENPAEGKVWSPISERVARVIRNYYGAGGLNRYLATGESDYAHDAVIQLVRYAYAFPTLNYSDWIRSLVHTRGAFGRDLRCRRRGTAAFYMPHYPLYVNPIMYQYDQLYDFIKGNDRIAKSVGRFVPWVKTSEDVIRLIDVYLVQTVAKRIMRYHYHTDPVDIANLAAVVGDNKFTRPWMEWLFSRTFIYPLPVSGIADAMISGTCRDGGEYIGSSYYVQGENALRVATSLEQYIKAGGDRSYDLSDAERYPKGLVHCYFRLNQIVAGWDFPRIGDVCGPDKPPGHTLRGLDFAVHGWRWTKDPQFAFILKHYVGRTGKKLKEAKSILSNMTSKEWNAIETAAAQQARAPWLNRRSRVLPQWAGILETGLQHDDPRFRRAAYVRIGYGYGHHHHDGLDLQISAHGIPMTIDGGQRPGYSSPGDRDTRLHNTVQIDYEQNFLNSHATALTDTPGARYFAAAAIPTGAGKLLRRQISLIDVDEGIGSQSLPPSQQVPGSKLPADITPANSYVFDVFRAAGGKAHTYNFHGPINDGFQWNATDVNPGGAAAPVPEGQTPDFSPARFLSAFSRLPDRNRVGMSPDTLEVTWRQRRYNDEEGKGGIPHAGTEAFMLGKNFRWRPKAGATPDAAQLTTSRRFMRLHLLDAKGATAMQAEAVCKKWKYHYTCAFLSRQSEKEGLETAFTAIIEPFIGRPFIVSKRLLSIAGNERDALRAVAAEVKTINGHTDINFADGRPDRTRSVMLGNGKLDVSAEHAFYGTDAAGLRIATLTGGTLLIAPEVKIEVATRERTATVSKVDYLEKTIWIDREWPGRASSSILEIGLTEPRHLTAYTALKVTPEEEDTRVLFQRGSDYYRSEVTSIEGDTVTCILDPMMMYAPGNRAGWVASNDSRTEFWRAEFLEERRFKLSGPEVTREAFGKEGALRLWEYGVGDTVRQSTSASLVRIVPGEYEFRSDADATIALRGSIIETAAPGEEWEEAQVQKADGWVSLRIPVGRAIDGPIRIRVK